HLAHLVGRHPVQVRKPEKGTRPKVFYIDGDADSLVPAAAPPPSDYMWSQAPASLPAMPLTEDGGAPRRTYGVREQHRNSWGWKVSAYLWTKSLAAGCFLVPAMSALASGAPGPAMSALEAALVFLALTGALLVWDLRQPRRFFWVLTRPQWRSWLTRGAYLIPAYGALLGPPPLLQLTRRAAPPGLTLLTALFAAAAALYSAFLFGQAKGRDL